MYYPESDILLHNNPEYERDITKLDKLLGTMGQDDGKLLKVEVISDIAGIKPGIIEFIFSFYCEVGILEAKKYILCPEVASPLNEIDDTYIIVIRISFYNAYYLI